MPASDRRARAFSIRCVSRVRLQRDRKSRRQTFGMLLRNFSAQLPVLTPPALGRVSFLAPSKVSDRALVHRHCPSQRRVDDRVAAALRWLAAEYRLSERQRAECRIEQVWPESAIRPRPGLPVKAFARSRAAALAMPPRWIQT